MRKLNYDIRVGTEFRLPEASWQVAKIAGNYRIQERRVEEYEDEDPAVSYICTRIDRPWQMPLEIAEMTLAYLLGEDVSAELDVVFDGRRYQPTGIDPYRVATEYCGTEWSEPFWYLAESSVRYHIDVDFETDRWCFFTLPWD